MIETKVRVIVLVVGVAAFIGLIGWIADDTFYWVSTWAITALTNMLFSAAIVSCLIVAAVTVIRRLR